MCIFLTLLLIFVFFSVKLLTNVFFFPFTLSIFTFSCFCALLFPPACLRLRYVCR